MWSGFVKPPDRNVYADQCPICSRLHYPSVLRCKECGYRRYPEDEAELYWRKKGYKSWIKVPLLGPCTLLTFTRLWALPEGFDEQFIDFGIVEFENGLKASGHLLVEDPEIGMKLTAEPGVVRRYPTHSEYGLHFVK